MLGAVRGILDAWLEVQNRWNHIAPLFGAQAFHEQLPEEVRAMGRPGGSGLAYRRGRVE
jgi:hypothetical protein